MNTGLKNWYFRFSIGKTTKTQNFQKFKLQIVIYTKWLQKKWLPQKYDDITWNMTFTAYLLLSPDECFLNCHYFGALSTRGIWTVGWLKLKRRTSNFAIPETYSKTCQTSKMVICKGFHFTCLTAFWICPCILWWLFHLQLLTRNSKWITYLLTLSIFYRNFTLLPPPRKQLWWPPQYSSSWSIYYWTNWIKSRSNI